MKSHRHAPASSNGPSDGINGVGGWRPRILAALAEREPQSLDDLIARLGLARLAQQEALARELVAMVRAGKLRHDRRGRYLLPEITAVNVSPAEPSPPAARDEAADRASAGGGKAGGGEIRGVVTAHRDGYGFVAADDGGPDVFLPEREMRGVLHGDRLQVRVTGTDARGRREGALIAIASRGTERVVGRLRDEGGAALLVPSNPRLPEVRVPNRGLGGARPGQVVVAELEARPNLRAQPSGRIVEILGDHLAPGMEIEAAIRANDLPHRFPAAAEREAAAFGDRVTRAQLRDREDLRQLPLLTVDGADAKDFDDAVAARRTRGGWTLWVAIADVSAYVTPDSPLDVEAQKRGTSVYFPETVIPMLPEVLSNGLCSLKPQIDRLCMVCEMRVGRDGQVTRSRFYPAVMRSHARMIYEDVAAALEDPRRSALAKRHPDLVAPLQALDEVFAALFAARTQRGAIDFDSSETRIVFGPDRKIDKIVAVARTRAHRLIEECMIAANVEAARLVARHKIAAPYRVHQAPDAEKVVLLREFLAARGFQLGGGDGPDAADFARALAAVAGHEEAGVIQNVMLRSLMQARYSADNVGHFGLALSHYAHFTSPIRRYPDLLLHRAIRHLLAGGKPRGFAYSHQQMQALCEHASMTERRADDAVRDVIGWLKCEYMQQHVGETFEGLVTGVAGFGVFVELAELYVDGMIHISRLGGDYWEYDARRHRLVGRARGATIGLGQRMRVRVVRVSLDERKIDLEPAAGMDEPGDARAVQSRKPGRRRRK
ncbi:MAG: ribonuclease R [Gammaproteobacteria bacterium]|nr:ribonuclease R [Gammaproteobacteria bacterium]